MPLVPGVNKLGLGVPSRELQLQLFGVPKSSASCPHLARYAISRRLRKTLFGETLLCRDVMHPEKKEMVLKRISLQALQDRAEMDASDPEDDGAEQPLRERQVIRALLQQPDHPHIVSYEREHAAVFAENNSLYLVMEYCNQGDLYDLVEQQPQNRLPEQQALQIVYQVAEGLAYLHANGIAHRDISPENVLLHNGVAKICDFGLSCNANTRHREAVGKLYYMAPECARRESYDPTRADVWSLGMILFVLLTGSPLIANERKRDAVFQVIRTAGLAKILEAWGMRGLCSDATLDLLSDMLQVDADHRPRIQQVLQHHAFAFLPFK